MAFEFGKLRDMRNRLIPAVRTVTGWKRLEIVIWFHIKNPRLGGRSPNDLLAEGKDKRLRTYIDTDLKKEMARE
jgi:hypothetical protein